MSVINAGTISGPQALELARQGNVLQCPVCSSDLKTVPEGGSMVSGLVCPKEPQHFTIFGESEDAVREMRARMKARAQKQK